MVQSFDGAPHPRRLYYPNAAGYDIVANKIVVLLKMDTWHSAKEVLHLVLLC